MKTILITGPAQSGKSTLAKMIYTRLPDHLVTTIRHHTAILYDWAYTYAHEIHSPAASMNREDFKRFLFPGGFTGRELLINVGEMARRLDRNFLSRTILDNAGDADVLIVDDLGFESEYQFFSSHAETQNPLVIYMESRVPERYEHGEQFQNDSRYCLKGYARMIDPTPQEVVDWILNSNGTEANPS